MHLKLRLDGDSQLVLSRYMMIHGYGSRCAVHFANKQNSAEFQPHKQVSHCFIITVGKIKPLIEKNRLPSFLLLENPMFVDSDRPPKKQSNCPNNII